MIKGFLEQAIRNIEAERERAVSVVKDRVIREKIAPYNTDIDNARAQDLSKYDAELNGKIVELQKDYNEKKQALIARVEQEKKNHYDTVIATELAVVTVEYDKHINKLKAQISEIKE